MSYRVEIPEKLEMPLCERLVELERKVWKMEDRDLLPAWKLLVTAQNGGIVAICYDGKAPIGLVVLSLAKDIITNEEYFYADMMGVHPKYQDTGVGVCMMTEVSEVVSKRGVEKVKWTFDPLEGRNAYLFIGIFGATVEKYYENYFGHLSGLNQNIPTDRFWVELKMNAVKTPVAKTKHIINLGDYKRIDEFVDGKLSPIAIEIPKSIIELRDRDIKKARSLRLSSRKVFQTLFSKGYVINGFCREGDRNFYQANSLR